MAAQRLRRSQAQDEVAAIVTAPVDDLGRTTMAVGADQDLDLWPAPADRAAPPTQPAADLAPGRPFGRAQDGADEAALAIEHDD